jgi:hypothetical protein
MKEAQFMELNYIKLGNSSGDGDMEKTLYDSNGDGVVDDSERLGGVGPSGYVKEVEREIVSSSIEQTNVKSFRYETILIASNGRTYFVGNYDTIKVLNDATGDIEEASSVSRFSTMGIASNGRTYFLGNDNNGIWVLNDATGKIEQTNITTGTFISMGIASNGRTYFGSSYNNGAMVLNNATGNIEQTNITTGAFLSIGVASNGRTYFGSGGNNNNGIWVLNDATGDIEQTNITTEGFRSMGIASNGRTYFGGNKNVGGIKVLNDATGNIEETNITQLVGFSTIGIASNGRTYFLSDNANSYGIFVLNDATGKIERTNITTGGFLSMGIASDGRTYFGGNRSFSSGIKVLNDATGDIEATNITREGFNSICIASDGRTYFGCDYESGILVLNIVYSDDSFVRKYGEWVDVEEYTKGKLDKAASTDTYESRYFHDDNGEGGHKVSAPDFAVIAALSRTVSSAVQRIVYVINSLNGYGTRLMHTMSKIYYTKGKDGEAFTDDDELATKGDIDHYSTDEMKVGTWIDGKPIYKKTFKIKSPKLVSSNVATDYDTGIFIDVPIRSETVFYHTDPTVNSGNVYYNSALQLRYVAGQYKSNASGNETLRVYVVLPYATSSSAFSECDVYITSYYTKTTD